MTREEGIYLYIEGKLIYLGDWLSKENKVTEGMSVKDKERLYKEEIEMLKGVIKERGDKAGKVDISKYLTQKIKELKEEINAKNKEIELKDRLIEENSKEERLINKESSGSIKEEVERELRCIWGVGEEVEDIRSYIEKERLELESLREYREKFRKARVSVGRLDIERLRVEGRSIREIARIKGVSIGTVYNRMREGGVK